MLLYDTCGHGLSDVGRTPLQRRHPRCRPRRAARRTPARATPPGLRPLGRRPIAMGLAAKPPGPRAGAHSLRHRPQDRRPSFLERAHRRHRASRHRIDCRRHSRPLVRADVRGRTSGRLRRLPRHMLCASPRTAMSPVRQRSATAISPPPQRGSRARRSASSASTTSRHHRPSSARWPTSFPAPATLSSRAPGPPPLHRASRGARRTHPGSLHALEMESMSHAPERRQSRSGRGRERRPAAPCWATLMSMPPAPRRPPSMPRSRN